MTSAPVVAAPTRDETDAAGGHTLADELAPMVGLWERLLLEHQPDANGRCRTCTRGGTGLPGATWPCSLYGLADLAQQRHQGAGDV